ncbi:MAG: MauE/DoxX family redox-associated membrane protein [Bacteroidota bacterium]|nr:MauE/DoxX family redox-associated membrane protein [Bacteroidota bacterium]
MNKNLTLIIRISVAALFLLSAFSKLYPTPLYGITKVFEQGQLIPMGFSANFAPYFSRFIIGVEFFLAFAILQRNFLKKIVLPSTILLLTLFSLHLIYQVILGESENCGCFGELIPMTPLQALIKNIITIVVLAFLYKNTEEDREYNFSKLSLQLLTVLLLMFVFVPIQTVGKNKRVSSFSEYVISDIHINEGKKMLCFFDAGCEHCMEAARSLTHLAEEIDFFPEIHIIFSDSEEDKIPAFFEFAEKEYSYQVLPFYNEDDEINSYLEILGYEYENPAIIYLDNGNQMRFYDGTGNNAFDAEKFKKLFQ